MNYIITSAIEFMAIVGFLWLYTRKDKVITWEVKQIERIKQFIRNRMRSNARFMAWLNKPQKHGKPDAEWISGQIKVFGDVWK